MKEYGIVALWQVCSGTGTFFTEYRNTKYTVCLIFRRTTFYTIKPTLHKSHSKILWFQNIWLIMGVFFKKNNRLSCCLWLQLLLTQKTKVSFSLFEFVVIKFIVRKLFYSKSTSEYVYCISFWMLYCMTSYISILSWHFTLNVRVGLILGGGEKFVPLNPT